MNVSFYDGAWHEETVPRISINDLGYIWGITISERLRTFGGQVFRLDEHLHRLARSLETIGVSPDEPTTRAAEIVPEAARRVHASLADGDDVGVLVLVSPGVAQGAPAGDTRSDDFTFIVTAYPLRFAEFAAKYASGQRLVVSDIRQTSSSSWPADLKCRSRMHYYLADLQARQVDPQARALLRNEHGDVCEASTANVLVVRDGRILSPLKATILPGVSLSMVEHLADERGVEFRFGRISPQDVRDADEVWLTSTSPCILPVGGVDGTPIADGKPGPMFRHFLDAWSDAVGIQIDQQAERFASRTA